MSICLRSLIIPFTLKSGKRLAVSATKQTNKALKPSNPHGGVILNTRPSLVLDLTTNRARNVENVCIISTKWPPFT